MPKSNIEISKEEFSLILSALYVSCKYSVGQEISIKYKKLHDKIAIELGIPDMSGIEDIVNKALNAGNN